LSACPTATRGCPAVRVAELDARRAIVSAQLDGTSAVAAPETCRSRPPTVLRHRWASVLDRLTSFATSGRRHVRTDA
jgi:hypothetical protein